MPSPSGNSIACRARSKELLFILDKVEKTGAGFRSLTENIDSTTASGRMMMQMLGAFAEFERAMVRERTQAGLRSARAQGRHGGRQPKLSPRQQAEVLAMLNAGRSAADVARLFRPPRYHQPSCQQCRL